MAADDSTPEPNGKMWIAVSVVAIAFLAATLLYTINVPWVEDDNAFGAAYAQAARNNLRAGLAVTAGVPATFYNGPLPIPGDAYYVHHPTLVPILITGVVAIFGEREWAVKLVPILCSIASAILLWWLVANSISRRAAAFAVAVFVTLPMELHYGDLVDYEPCLVMWMLAALTCFRNWDVHRARRWAVFAAICSLGALWTDWPGYLFAAAVAIWLVLKKERSARRLAAVLVALAVASGLLFLLQIRHANPEAWGDLWTAITMRLGNGTQAGSSANVSSGAGRFGFSQWLGRIFHALGQNYLRTTWILMLGGAFYLFHHRKSPGARWVGTAALLMAAAGIPYLVILRNWSFIHDFASFFVIGSIAILGGLGLEAIWQWIEERLPANFPRALAGMATALLLATLAWIAFNRAQDQRSQFLILDDDASESANLIPDLGRYLSTIFPATTTILCNFDPYFSPLSYYANRDILRNLTTADDWDFAIRDEEETFGGIVWLGAPGAGKIIAALPPGEISQVEIAGTRFAVWHGRGQSVSAR